RTAHRVRARRCLTAPTGVRAARTLEEALDRREPARAPAGASAPWAGGVCPAAPRSQRRLAAAAGVGASVARLLHGPARARAAVEGWARERRGGPARGQRQRDPAAHAIEPC